MARIDTLTNFLTDVADSIRSKTGKSDAIACEDFDTEIESISGGANLQTKSVTITENTTTSITPDEGYDGLESVNVITSISPDVPVFSTTETVVGTWIDNKPLYMKTITQDITTSSTGSFDVNIPHGLSNIGIMFLGNNSFIGLKSDMSQSYPINYTNTTSNTYSQMIRTQASTNGNVRTLSGGSIFEGNVEITAVINVFYTKASDVAVSDISLIKGNHYSETEHIVGETSDGETVYEKTVLKSAYLTATQAFNQTFAHNISNIDKIWISDGSFFYSTSQSATNRLYLPSNYIHSNTDKRYQFSRCKADNTNVNIYVGGYIFGAGTLYTITTLRYMKNEV